MKNLIIITVVALSLFASVALAQNNQQPETVTIPKEMLSPEQLKQIEQMNTRQEITQRVEEANEWAQWSQEIGILIRTTLTSLADALGIAFDSVEDLADTSVGKFMLFIVAVKIVGHDAIQVAVGFPLFLVGFWVFVWIVKNNFLTRTVNVGTKQEPVIELIRADHTQLSVAFFCFLVFSALCAIIILA